MMKSIVVRFIVYGGWFSAILTAGTPLSRLPSDSFPQIIEKNKLFFGLVFLWLFWVLGMALYIRGIKMRKRLKMPNV